PRRIREVNQMRSKVALIALALAIATPGLVTAKTKAVQDNHGYTATQTTHQSCGEYKYWEGGKCEDRTNKGKRCKRFELLLPLSAAEAQARCVLGLLIEIVGGSREPGR